MPRLNLHTNQILVQIFSHGTLDWVSKGVLGHQSAQSLVCVLFDELSVLAIPTQIHFLMFLLLVFLHFL